MVDNFQCFGLLLTAERTIHAVSIGRFSHASKFADIFFPKGCILTEQSLSFLRICEKF
jgi:hypothetical protein